MKTQISQTYNYKLNDNQQSKINDILKTPPKTIKKLFNIDEKYYQLIKRYLNKIKSNKYIVNDKYFNSSCGRMMGHGTTLQGMESTMLGFILDNNAYDIDMKNAGFSFVKYIINTHFKDDNFKKLLDYADNRENYFINGFDKLKWISILFSEDTQSYINKDKYDKDFNRLILEIDIFKNLISKNLNIWSNINFEKCDHIGSKISFIIFHYENDLIQDILGIYKDITIASKFDGAIIQTECDLEMVLLSCDKLGDKYGIKFINKEFKTIELNLDDSPPNYEDQKNDQYEKMKIEFEENHFMVENPLLFVYQYTKTDGTIATVLHNKADFTTQVKPFQLKTDKGSEDFFNEWIKDKDRRAYKTINWIPDENHIDEQIFNSFTGFKAQYLGKEFLGDGSNNVERFLNHIGLLCNEEAEASIYITKFCAHMFQKPTELPQTALLFRSEEGVGKDLFTETLGKIIGMSLLKKEANIENILGTFNKSLKNKLILQINEINGKVGHESKDQLTANILNIREMRTDIVEYDNYLRVFLFTNNLNPINISHDNRRYLVFKTGRPKNANNKIYYTEYAKMLEDEKALDEIYTFLMNLDIKGFVPHIDRCETQAYKNIQEHNSNPFYEYLMDMVKKPSLYGVVSKKDEDYISTKDFNFSYQNWLEENDMTHIQTNNKLNKALLLDLNCSSVKFSINNTQVRGYKLDLKNIKYTLINVFKIKENEMVIDLGEGEQIDLESDY